MRPLILLPKRIAISAFPKPHLNLLHISRKVAQLTNQNSPTPCKKSATTTPPVTKLAFWTDKPTWSRAGVNTLRCLVGCTLGDFSALWMLQSLFPEMGMGAVMGVSMASGLLTSLTLETVLLVQGKDRLPWKHAFKTACGMSFISMLAMESVQNLVDYHLTGGVVVLGDPGFWAAAVAAMGAGFLAPLPWNYFRLRAWKKACH
ncbi:hypothetical protein BDV29DRAFT_167612 [Aspergillus leporis]|uniref:DUF4396 domain-containing protein n=1 Tax=Aspergillus leporis TaxID=41062 RepID=A0A5N5XCS2_9EURO|nr:hypothetical protein BDV29DRAFT_167612 [Aspergillus leporis]